MSQTAEDRWLDRILRELPRERASNGFTARVMRATTRPATARPAGSRPWAARRGFRLAFAAMAVLLIGGVWGAHQHRERQAAEARFAALRAEYHAVRAELEELRELQAAARGVVYLGSTDDVDLVVDLPRLARRLEASGRSLDELWPGERNPALIPQIEPVLHPADNNPLPRKGEIYR